MTTPYRPSFLAKSWFKFKSIRLPWRRRVFAGFDLDGNKFYESYNPLHPTKPRRTVEYVHDGHYTDNQVTPQWMSWLRYTRAIAPTLAELEGEGERIRMTRRNAELVSRRWDEERARLKLTSGASSSAVASGGAEESAMERQEGRRSVIQEARKQEEMASGKGTDGDGDGYIPAPGTRDDKGEWQPESWTPGPVRR